MASLNSERPYWQHQTKAGKSSRFYTPIGLQQFSDRYFEDFYISKPNGNKALLFRTAGLRHCEPEFHIVNKTSSRYTMHFILSGKGWCDGTIVESGDIIFFDRYKLHNFSVDSHDPCVYAWITFKGDAVEALLQEIGLSDHNQIYHTDLLPQICAVMYELLYVDHSDVNLNLYMESCLMQLFALSVNHNPPPEEPTIPYNSLKKQHLEQALRYISQNYNSTNFRISDIADAIGMNPTYFRKFFREQTGSSPRDYVLRLRINAAITLLKSSNYNINEIASFCGYNNYAQFSEQFKKATGMAPSKYKGSGLW